MPAEQIVCVKGVLVTVVEGLTVIVTVIGVPGQPTPDDKKVGVIV